MAALHRIYTLHLFVAEFSAAGARHAVSVGKTLLLWQLRRPPSASPIGAEPRLPHGIKIT